MTMRAWVKIVLVSFALTASGCEALRDYDRKYSVYGRDSQGNEIGASAEIRRRDGKQIIRP